MRTLPVLYSVVFLANISVACGTDLSQPVAPAPRRSATSATDPAVGPEGTADLALTSVVDRTNVRVGENITFTITLTNLGPATATGVIFGDAIPDPLNLVSFTCHQGTVSGLSWCDVGDMAPGANASATLVATPIPHPPQSERRFYDTATILASDLPDSNNGNNMASTQIHIIGSTQ